MLFLNMYEGVGGVTFNERLRELLLTRYRRTKLGALLIKKELKEDFERHFQMEQYGGAPLLGLEGISLLRHTEIQRP